MKLPDIPYWFVAGLNLASILVISEIIPSFSSVIEYLIGTFFVILNSLSLLYFSSKMFSRTSDETGDNK